MKIDLFSKLLENLSISDGDQSFIFLKNGILQQYNPHLVNTGIWEIVDKNNEFILKTSIEIFYGYKEIPINLCLGDKSTGTKILSNGE